MATIETIELVINRVGALQETEKGTENGNRYIVAETSRGSVVFSLAAFEPPACKIRAIPNP